MVTCFFAVQDSFFIVKNATDIFKPGTQKLLFAPKLDKDSNLVITSGRQVKGFSLGKNIMPTCFMDDFDGTIYVGTNHGIYQFDKRTGLFFHLVEIQNNTTVTCIVAPEMYSELWFGTLEKGLGSYNRFSRTVMYHPYQENKGSSVSN